MNHHFFTKQIRGETAIQNRMCKFVPLESLAEDRRTPVFKPGFVRPVFMEIEGHAFRQTKLGLKSFQRRNHDDPTDALPHNLDFVVALGGMLRFPMEFGRNPQNCPFEKTQLHP